MQLLRSSIAFKEWPYHALLKNFYPRGISADGLSRFNAAMPEKFELRRTCLVVSSRCPLRIVV